MKPIIINPPTPTPTPNGDGAIIATLCAIGLAIALLVGSCGGITMGGKIADECRAKYPNSPSARETCESTKKVEFTSCRSGERAYGVKLDDSDCT